MGPHELCPHDQDIYVEITGAAAAATEVTRKSAAHMKSLFAAAECDMHQAYKICFRAHLLEWWDQFWKATHFHYRRPSSTSHRAPMTLEFRNTSLRMQAAPSASSSTRLLHATSHLSLGLQTVLKASLP